MKNKNILILPAKVYEFTECKHVWYQSRVLLHEIGDGSIYFEVKLRNKDVRRPVLLLIGKQLGLLAVITHALTGQSESETTRLVLRNIR